MDRRNDMNGMRNVLVASVLACGLWAASLVAQQTPSPVPTGQLRFGMFAGRFNADGTFSIEGKDWPALQGTWKARESQIDLAPDARGVCHVAGKYQFRVNGRRLSFEVVSDDCAERKLVLDHSTWTPAEDGRTLAPRHIVQTPSNIALSLSAPEPSAGSWPSSRGPVASCV